MQRAHWRYLLANQVFGAAAINAGINGGFAWGIFGGLEAVPLWGQTSIVGDTLSTAVLLPLLTGLIATTLVRRDVRDGRIGSMTRDGGKQRFGARLPKSALGRGLLLAGAALVFAAAPAVACLALLGVTEMSPPAFIGFKVAFAVALGLAVTPYLALAALGDPPSAAS